jgi:hypothetical protein
MNITLPGVKTGTTSESLFKTIGFIVVNWGHCEQSLELLVSTLFREYGGNKLPKVKKMPKPLSAKIAFVKECANHIPALAPFRTEIESLVCDFDALTQTRHDLVHGAITDTPVIEGVYSFIRLDTHPDIHEVKYFQYDLKAFPSFAEALLRLGSDAPKLARRVFDARPRHP